jgi:hypothetical protein
LEHSNVQTSERLCVATKNEPIGIRSFWVKKRGRVWSVPEKPTLPELARQESVEQHWLTFVRFAIMMIKDSKCNAASPEPAWAAPSSRNVAQGRTMPRFAHHAFL